MANLSITEGADSRQNLGFSGIIQIGKLQPSLSDYPVGGYPIAPSAFGMARLHGMWLIGVNGGASNYLWQWQHDTNTLKVFGTGGGAGQQFNEIAANTNLQPGTYYFIGFGF